MATKKEVHIIARYTNKKTGVVCYLVRSSDGKTEYCTTIIDGKASGCSCPAHGNCYHKKQLENKEQARKFAAKSLPVWTVELVKSGKLVAPGKPVKQAKVIQFPIKTAPKKDMMTAALTTNRGFSLMR